MEMTEARDKTESTVTQMPSRGRPKTGDTAGKTKAAGQKYKIQIQLSPSSRDRLEQLVDRTDAESATQVIRDALRVYDILVEEVSDKGSELFLRTEDDDIVKLRLF